MTTSRICYGPIYESNKTIFNSRFFLSFSLSLISIKIIQYNVFYITFYIKLPLVYINVFMDVFPCVICCCGNVHLEIGATIFSEREREKN